jgi:hypothetical protein
LSKMPSGCASAIRGSSRIVLIVSLSKEGQTGAADQRLCCSVVGRAAALTPPRQR